METDFKNLMAQEIAQTFINFKKLGFKKDHGIGIRQSEFMLLTTLVQLSSESFKGIKISELGSQLQITPAGVTHIIDTLVEKKLVERKTDPSDRRLVLIKATEKGTEVVNSMQLRFIKRCEDLASFLGEKDSRELIRLLSKTFNFFNQKN